MIFLVQTPHAWRGIRQRPHHLMTRFARRGHAVRWVESRYARWLVGRSAEFFRARSERPEANLEVRPVTLINGERLAPIRAWNKARLARVMDRPPTPGAKGPRVLWIYSPHEGHLVDRVAHDLVVYDIMDEYRGFPWSPSGIVEEENELLRRADCVFAGTRALYEAKGRMARGLVECILSGVEVEHFARGSGATDEQGAAAADPVHRDLRARYRRLLGYAGMIDLRIDQAMLRAAARKFAHWGFVLLGPVATNVDDLRDVPNIHLLGARPYADLPSYYHAWDAAALPFIDNELTRHINPTKILEYGAAGLPIIARALPDVERYYADGAWLYRTGEEFMARLRDLDEASPADRAPRLQIARGWADQRGWDALAGRMLETVASLLKSKRVKP